MSLSRGIHLIKNINASVRKSTLGIIQPSRNSGGLYSYRVGCYPHTKFQSVGSLFMRGFMWWWIFWHIWHEPDHIWGEFPYPNPRSWTDEELGIPPDSAM